MLDARLPGLMLLLVLPLGCAMCANPHDCKYAAYGGVRDRAGRAQGRVASIFDPADEVSYEADSEQSGTPIEVAPPILEGDPTLPEEPTLVPETGAENSPSDKPTISPDVETLPEMPSTDGGDGIEPLPEIPNGDEGELPPIDDAAAGAASVPLGLGVVPASATVPVDANDPPATTASRHPLADLFADEGEGRE